MIDRARRPIRVGVWPGSNRTGNPFVDLFAGGLRLAGVQVVDVQDPTAIMAGSIDVFHIHWPEQIFWAGGGIRGIFLRLLATLRHLHRLKQAGIVIVWMVHNLEPHDLSWKRRLLWRIYCQQLCALSDGFMTSSPATIDVVRQRLPGLRSKTAGFVWHPTYPRVEPCLPRAAIRGQLGVQEGSCLYGFLGKLRPYKGIEELIDVFRQLPGHGDHLLIAGGPADHAYASLISDIAAQDPRISVVARELSDAEFVGYQAAADVVVLPFRESLHSGSMVHAVCEARPVVTPDTPFARALAGEVGDGWVRIYCRPLKPQFLLDCRTPASLPNLQAFSPLSLGQNAIAFYQSLLMAGDARRNWRNGSDGWFTD